MKNLVQFIKESSNNMPSELPEEMVKAVGAVMTACRKVYNKLVYTKDFEINKKNEKLIIDYINDKKLCSEFTFMNTVDYYEKVFNPGEKWKTNPAFDAQYGDIIVLDETGSEVVYIDLKLGNKYFGSISYGSLTQFEEAGVYVCVNLSTGSVKGITHKKVCDYLEEHPEFLEPKSSKNTSQSKEINGFLGKHNSEDYVQGKILRSI